MKLSVENGRSSENWGAISISSNKTWSWSGDWLWVSHSNGNSQSDDEEDSEKLEHVDDWFCLWGSTEIVWLE